MIGHTWWRMDVGSRTGEPLDNVVPGGGDYASQTRTSSGLIDYSRCVSDVLLVSEGLAYMCFMGCISGKPCDESVSFNATWDSDTAFTLPNGKLPNTPTDKFKEEPCEGIGKVCSGRSV